MEAVFLKVLNMSTVAAWMIVAVIVLRLLMKKAPSVWRCALWIVVALRLVCPFSFESPFSFVPSTVTFSEEFLFAASPTVQSGFAGLDNIVNPILSENLKPNPTDSVNPAQVLSFSAAVVWIVGMVLLLLYGVFSALRVRHQVRTAVRLRDNIWQCDHLPSPFILGLFRSRIYLPTTLPDAQIAHVLAHECAHIERGDHWWKLLGFVLLALHWFNPLVWVAYILLCRDIELACDERVIKAMSVEDKKAYSEALLRCSVSRPLITVCPLAFGEVGVKKRIQAVLRYTKPAKWMLITAAITFALFTVGFTTDPQPTAATPLYYVSGYHEGSVKNAVVTECYTITQHNGVPYINFYVVNKTGTHQTLGMWYDVQYKENFEDEEYESCRVKPRFLFPGWLSLADEEVKTVSFNLAPFDLSRKGVYRFSFGNPSNPVSFTFKLIEIAEGDKISIGIHVDLAMEPLEKLVEEHSYIVRGTITRYGPAVLIATTMRTPKYIQVSEVFRGHVEVGSEIFFYDLGGENDTHFTKADPDYGFEIGTEAYFFIAENGGHYPLFKIKNNEVFLYKNALPGVSDQDGFDGTVTCEEFETALHEIVAKAG